MTAVPSPRPDRTIPFLLSVIAVALTVIALKPLVTPPPAYAGAAIVPEASAGGITALANVGTGRSPSDISAAFVRYEGSLVIITNRGGKWEIVKSIPLRSSRRLE